MQETKRRLEQRIQEMYKDIKPYMKREDATKELREMCQNCDGYCGIDHDYEECKGKPCFRFWLCYEIEKHTISFGG